MAHRQRVKYIQCEEVRHCLSERPAAIEHDQAENGHDEQII
jgi:hypothetical protein